MPPNTPPHADPAAATAGLLDTLREWVAEMLAHDGHQDSLDWHAFKHYEAREKVREFLRQPAPPPPSPAPAGLVAACAACGTELGEHVRSVHPGCVTAIDDERWLDAAVERINRLCWEASFNRCAPAIRAELLAASQRTPAAAPADAGAGELAANRIIAAIQGRQRPHDCPGFDCATCTPSVQEIAEVLATTPTVAGELAAQHRLAKTIRVIPWELDDGQLGVLVEWANGQKAAWSVPTPTSIAERLRAAASPTVGDGEMLALDADFAAWRERYHLSKPAEQAAVADAAIELLHRYRAALAAARKGT